MCVLHAVVCSCERKVSVQLCKINSETLCKSASMRNRVNAGSHDLSEKRTHFHYLLMEQRPKVHFNSSQFDAEVEQKKYTAENYLPQQNI